MALCLVCDLSSIASERVGKVFFKEKTDCADFFFSLMCLGNSRKEPSHSRQIETRELIHRFLMGTAKNFEQLLGRTVMSVYVSWQTIQLVYRAHQVDFRKSMRFRV